MKKLFLLISICLAAVSLRAQENNNAKDYDNYVTIQDKKINTAYDAKNYDQAIQYSIEWLSTYEKQPANVKTNYKGNTINVYYNLACFNARTGKQGVAIDWLKHSVLAGFNDYTTIAVDSDLVTLRNLKDFKTIVQQVREKGDYGYILKMAGLYNGKRDTSLPVFTYQDQSSPQLISFRTKFNLDSIAGNGDETSRFIKLLYWVHNIVRHDGSSDNPPKRNAIDLIAICKKENRGVNCRMMATILRDVYQAEGFNARIVTCMPKDTADFDCHVITVVWSKILSKWVWMDPTFNAYVSDEKGNLLNIEEVRNRMIDDKPWELNEDANWNNRSKETKADYLRYMSKNLYWLKCSAKSEWDLETFKDNQNPVQYINLYPGNFTTLHQPKPVNNGSIYYATNNPGYFWQKPQGD